MKTISNNPVLRFVLIAALLTAQCSTQHIHLATQHDHDGAPHLHELEVHATHLAPKLAKLELGKPVADFVHHPSDIGVLYIDSSFNPTTSKHRLTREFDDDPPIGFQKTGLPTTFIETSRIATDQKFVQRTDFTHPPRAPPLPHLA